MERVRDARHVLAVGHESPDADALGAAIAIGLLVEALGGRATRRRRGPVAAISTGSSTAATPSEPTRSRTSPTTCVVLCDCGDLCRVGSIRERNAALFADTPLLTIDHHASNDGSGGLAWIDPAAAATCEMVALLAVRLGVPLAAGRGGSRRRWRRGS